MLDKACRHPANLKMAESSNSVEIFFFLWLVYGFNLTLSNADESKSEWLRFVVYIFALSFGIF